MKRNILIIIALSLIFTWVNSGMAQETYNMKIISDGTDWFKVMMFEIGAEAPIDASSIELVSTLLPIHAFNLDSDFWPNGGEVSYSRVPFGPSDAQLDLDVSVNWQLKIASLKGSLGTLTIQIWHNNVLEAEYVNDITGDWCFQAWAFYPSLDVEPPEPGVPTEDNLGQNYPNPFNPSTTIQYSVQQNSPVKIDIYNSLGQHVQTLVDETVAPGDYTVTWDGTTMTGQQAAAGTYFYELQIDDQHYAKKMIMLK